MEAITAKELRIGNYLHFKGSDLVAKVQLINAPSHFDCRDEYGNFIPNGEFDPIPLSEDWLKRFGFEIRHFNGDENKPLWWKVEHNRHIDIYPHKEHGFYFLINSLQMSTPINEVHKLQNLYFALTGTELTLNL